MIQVYEASNTNYEMNGDMVLLPDSCELEMELNGNWELTLKHLVDEEGRWEYLKEGNVICAPTPVGERQLFRIHKKQKTYTQITVYARPVFFDAAKDVFLLDTRPTAKNGQEALNIMTAGTRYQASSNITAVNTAYYINRNLIEALQGDIDHSFLNRWGGEILYDNFRVIINDRVGGDYGVRAEFGRNLNSIEETIDRNELITRIVPMSYNGHMLTGSKPWVDSPNINKYPIIYTKLVKFEEVKLTEDCEEGEEGFSTLAELCAELIKRSRAMFDEGYDLPKCNYVIDMLDLSKMEEYKDYEVLETVMLGDTIRCIHRALGIETKARVIRITYDCILQKNIEEELGSPELDYFSNIDADLESILNRVTDAIREDGSVVAGAVKGFLDAAKTQLWYQKNVAQRQDVRAILFEDLDPNSNLYGALALGTQGLQISKRRTEDGRDWDWTTALTANGLLANIIVTGILSDKRGKNYWDLDRGEFSLSAQGFMVDGQAAEDYFKDSWTQEDAFNKVTNNGKSKGIYMSKGELYVNATYIKGGTLELGGSNNVNGKLRILDAEGVTIGRWDKDGVYVKGGSIYCKTPTTGVSIYGGRMYLTHGDTDVGYIGTNQMNGYESYKGLVFDLESTGAYMAWASRTDAALDYYIVRLLYANKTFSTYKSGTFYVSCNTDFMDHEIQNVYIKDLKVRDSFNIPGNTDCDVYSDMDFHNWTIQNVKINNLVAINGITPYNGTFKFIESIENNADGGISWRWRTATVRNGIITDV